MTGLKLNKDDYSLLKEREEKEKKDKEKAENKDTIRNQTHAGKSRLGAHA
jgi:hypothetical protein